MTGHKSGLNTVLTAPRAAFQHITVILLFFLVCFAHFKWLFCKMPRLDSLQTHFLLFALLCFCWETLVLMASYCIISAVSERKFWSIETVPAVLSEHVGVLKKYSRFSIMNTAV